MSQHFDRSPIAISGVIMNIHREFRRIIFCMIVAFLGILATTTVTDAQQRKVPRVGFLALARFVPPKLFLEDLEKLGFVDGKNLSIEYHFADGKHSQMRSLAAELVRSNVDVIFANGDEAVVAAIAETKTIPIVMLSCDALAMGFVPSLARPGGNITGVTCISVELSPKRVEVFKELFPGLSHIAVIYNPENVAKPFDAKGTIASAEKIGIKGHYREDRAKEYLKPAFAATP